VEGGKKVTGRNGRDPKGEGNVSINLQKPVRSRKRRMGTRRKTRQQEETSLEEKKRRRGKKKKIGTVGWTKGIFGRCLFRKRRKGFWLLFAVQQKGKGQEEKGTVPSKDKRIMEVVTGGN